MNYSNFHDPATDKPAMADPSDPFTALKPWDEEKARYLADLEGIELTKEHLYLVKALRDCYRDNPHMSAREALGCLELNMLGTDAKQHLYTLFPDGPVRQAAHIAGIPVPAGAENHSFGNVM
jgi:tRNA 2-thiouridine synthesizing protein E